MNNYKNTTIIIVIFKSSVFRVARPFWQVPKQQLEFYEVECLVFSFRQISQIDNLVGFSVLTKLQLDNNNITKIENLGHLVTLQWLVCVVHALRSSVSVVPVLVFFSLWWYFTYMPDQELFAPLMPFLFPNKIYVFTPTKRK